MDSEPEVVVDEYQKIEGHPEVPTAPAADVKVEENQKGEEEISKEALLAAFSATRFCSAVYLMSAAGHMWTTNPGAHYMISGILLTGSFVTEYVAKAIDMVTFGLTLIGSFLIIIGGSMSFERRDVHMDTIGIMWMIAAGCLFIAHSYDAVTTYRKVNFILTFSKVLAISGSILFIAGGILLYVLEDLEQEDIWKFANLFIYGGVFYLAHAITMATGHQSVIDSAHAYEGYVATPSENRDSIIA